MGMMGIGLGWAFAAFVALALAMPRHQEQMLGRELTASAAWGWRLAGVAGLAAALWACLQAWSPSLALAVWLGVLTIAAMLVGWLAAYRPRLLVYAAAPAVLAGAVALAWRG